MQIYCNKIAKTRVLACQSNSFCSKQKIYGFDSTPNATIQHFERKAEGFLEVIQFNIGAFRCTYANCVFLYMPFFNDLRGATFTYMKTHVFLLT
jgi:hypothetical protein